MVTSFEFATAARIIFGNGRVAELGPAAKPFGKRALLVRGASAGRAISAESRLREHGIDSVPLSIIGEPDLEAVRQGAEFARAEKCDFVLGFGGGSVIDASKAIAALATNAGDLIDYLEVIGRARPLSAPPLPVIAVPTTAGTGAEVTRNAVLASPEHRVKASLRHAQMLPRVAIVDPELTRGLPPALTASTGMDALTQLIEPFVSKRANALTDALCREAIPRAARALPRAFANGADADAREEMSLASLFGGLALANAGLGAVHGFAGPIGGMFSAAHGAICASLLPAVMEVNLAAARDHSAREILDRYAEVARMMTGGLDVSAESGVEFVQALCRELKVPRLGDFGITRADFPAIAEKAAQSSSMKGNPVPLTPPQLASILERAL